MKKDLTKHQELYLLIWGYEVSNEFAIQRIEAEMREENLDFEQLYNSYKNRPMWFWGETSN